MKKRSLRESIKNCIDQCLYRKNVSSNNYKMYEKDSIDFAETEIRAWAVGCLGEKITVISDYAWAHNAHRDFAEKKLKEE